MLRFPVDIPFRITSKYGGRVDPITGAFSGHNGIDIAMPQGTPIYAPARGTVQASYYSSTGGNSIILDHPGQIRTGYAHLSTRLVVPGQKVNKNDLIGFSGSTGRSTGPHLHLTVKRNGKQVDPLSVAWNYKHGQNLTPQIPIKRFSSIQFVKIAALGVATGTIIYLVSNKN